MSESNPSGRGLRYTPYYCEENVWHLAGDPRFAGLAARVVVISNPDRCCALWQQRAAGRPGAPIAWDYHVVLGVGQESGWEIWDLDTELALPCPATEWLARTFLPLREDYRRLAPRFRLIDVSEYRARFSSDRSHMRAGDGSWHKPPPSWPPIVRAGEPSFLRWTEMTADDNSLTLLELAQRLATGAV